MTLVEVVIALVLLALILGKGVMVASEAEEAMTVESSRLAIEDQARRLLDQIALAIMGSDRTTLLPNLENEHNASLRYRVSLGVDDGEVVWSNTEEIALGDTGEQVLWKERPDEADELRVVWSRIVRDLLDGEVQNGVDDNGNGLVDENGLSFEIDGRSVTIRISLQRVTDGGSTISETVETTVTCRN